jgi:hypothetical protein
MKKLLNCVVCEASEAKYKFRCCRKTYCSLGCFNRHENCLEPVEQKPYVPDRRYVREDNCDLNLNDDEFVSETLFEKLIQDDDLRYLLRDPLLQRLLVKVDNARDRRQIFSRLCETSPAFINLVNRICHLTGYRMNDQY